MSRSKTVCSFSIILILKISCILLNKNINQPPSTPLPPLPFTGLERRNLKNHKLKVKLWWVGAHERKEKTFFVSFILSEENSYFISMYGILNTLSEYSGLSLIRTLRGNLNLFELWRVRIMGSRSFLKHFGNRNSNYRPK